MGNRKESRKKQEVHFHEEEEDQQQLVDFEPEGEDEDQHGGGEGLPPSVAAQADSSGAFASYHQLAAASPDGVGARLIVCRNSVRYVVSWNLVSWNECNCTDIGLTLKPSKISFGPKSIECLGHIISAKGISVGKDRIKAVQNLPTPRCLKDLRSVLGVVNFVRRFIPDYAEITNPLVELTRKEYATKSRFVKAWNKSHDASFAHLKRLLTSAPVLHFPDFDREFVVHVDASEHGCGAFLAQPSKADPESLDMIAYYSHRFKYGQRHYSASMKEGCGVVLAISHWRPYLFGKHFTVITDYQALTHLYMQDTSNMLLVGLSLFKIMILPSNT
ncbi:unnamed protein product [Ectocarpus sp. CCAP 1310/34]|nr:unnamed protein product [Ectocarpus sp. CCAP 1310/34]